MWETARSFATYQPWRAGSWKLISVIFLSIRTCWYLYMFARKKSRWVFIGLENIWFILKFNRDQEKIKHFQLWREHKMNFEFFFFLIFQFSLCIIIFCWASSYTSLEWSIPLHDPIQATNLYNFRGFFFKNIKCEQKSACLLEEGKKDEKSSGSKSLKSNILGGELLFEIVLCCFSYFVCMKKWLFTRYRYYFSGYKSTSSFLLHRISFLQLQLLSLFFCFI